MEVFAVRGKAVTSSRMTPNRRVAVEARSVAGNRDTGGVFRLQSVMAKALGDGGVDDGMAEGSFGSRHHPRDRNPR